MRLSKAIDFIHAAALQISFLPIFALICQIADLRTDIILLQALCLIITASAASFFINPHRNFLHYAYAVTAALISFLLNIRINLFYRTTIAVLILIICMLTSYKKKTTIQSVYMFAISAFVNIIICFLLDNSFLPLICFFTYVITFGFTKYLRSQERLSKKYFINLKISAIPITALLLVTLMSVPVSDFIAKSIKSGLRKLLNNNQTENPISETLESNTEYTAITETINTEQNFYIKYIFIALILLIVLLFIINFRNEILSFLSNSPKRFNFNKPSLIAENNEYTEITVPLEKNENISVIYNSNYKKWRKNYHRYKKIEWSDSKLKTGFELAVNGLRLYGIEIKSSETLSDIEKKVPEEFLGLWKKIESHYSIYKYNDELPDKSAQNSFDDIISALYKKIYKKRNP